MRFEARELKPHGEPVSLESLKVGEVYFAFFVPDNDGKVPTLLPRVFIGRNLEPDDENELYFRDFESYKHGIRFNSSTTDDEARFESGAEKDIFEYERALDLLMSYALRRRDQP